MKKLLITVFCIILLAGAGIGIWLGLPRGKDELDFDVSTSVNLTIGQEKQLEYTCNIKDVVISFVNENDTIAEIVYKDGKVYILGKAEGETNVEAIAKYGEQKIEKEIVVIVSSVATLPEEPNDEKPEDEPVDDPNDDPNETPSENPKEDGDDEEVNDEPEQQLGLRIEVVDGCEISGDTITMKSTIAFVTITTEEDMAGELGFEASAGLTIAESKFGSYTYMIEVESSGSYSLKIYCNGKSKTYIITL